MPAPLAWTTVINSTPLVGKKTATTHFGVTYALIKDGRNWTATITHPFEAPETLLGGVSFARARRAALDDYKVNGGR